MSKASPSTSSTPAQRLAEAVSARMYQQDNAAHELGIELDTIAPGYARLRMQVRESMLNGHRICHGGFIFTLADCAFAYACNSYNHSTVAARASIDFLAPAQRDDLLTAVAEERVLAGRTGIYDITVRDQHGRLVALFRGNSHRLKETILTEEELPESFGPNAEPSL